jgi:hypothetical protein
MIQRDRLDQDPSLPYEPAAAEVTAASTTVKYKLLHFLKPLHWRAYLSLPTLRMPRKPLGPTPAKTGESEVQSRVDQRGGVKLQ